MFAVVEHVILLRLTSPGNGWKQKCLPALRIQAWLFQNQQLSQEIRDPLHSSECLEGDQQAKAETGSADKRLRLSGDRAELSIWPMIFHPLKIHAARSLTEDRLQIRKDLGKIQVGLCARTEVSAGMGIHRDDRLYPDLEIAAYPDDAGIDRTGRPPRERPIERRRRCEFNQRNPSLRVAGPGTI